MNVYADSTLAYAYARDVNVLEGDRVSLGVTGKFIHRASINQLRTAGDLATGGDFFRKDLAVRRVNFRR